MEKDKEREVGKRKMKEAKVKKKYIQGKGYGIGRSGKWLVGKRRKNGEVEK